LISQVLFNFVVILVRISICVCKDNQYFRSNQNNNKLLNYKVHFYMDNNETKAIRRELAALNRKLDGIADIINQDVRVPDRLISVREASKLLNRSEYCLRIDINQGRIPAKKVGRGYLLSYNYVQSLIQSPTGQ